LFISLDKKEENCDGLVIYISQSTDTVQESMYWWPKYEEIKLKKKGESGPEAP